MIDQSKYQALKQKAENARKSIQRAEGALSETLKRMKTEFGCDSLEDAEKLLEEMRSDLKDLETSYNSKVKAFEEKWGDLLQ